MALPFHQLHAIFNRNRRRPRVFRDRTNPFDTLNDFEFLRHFRFSKNSAHQIVQLFRRHITPTTRRNHALSPEVQILLTLHYLGANSVQRDDARLAGVKQPTACSVIHKVVHVIASHRATYIKFPIGNARVEAQAGFRRLAHDLHVDPLPGVVASVDGCHVRLEASPCHPLPGMYYNRKSFYSVNVQLACDADATCVDVVARWYGSAHDSRVFQNSTLDARLGNGTYQGILLADSAYPNYNYILKPMRNPNTLMPKNGLRVHLEHAEGVIVACAVLHNISVLFNQPVPDESDDEDDDELENSEDEDDDQNRNMPVQSRAQYIRVNFP